MELYQISKVCKDIHDRYFLREDGAIFKRVDSNRVFLKDGVHWISLDEDREVEDKYLVNDGTLYKRLKTWNKKPTLRLKCKAGLRFQVNCTKLRNIVLSANA